MLPKSLSSTAKLIPQARAKKRISKAERTAIIKERFNLTHGPGKRKKKKK